MRNNIQRFFHACWLTCVYMTDLIWRWTPKSIVIELNIFPTIIEFVLWYHFIYFFSLALENRHDLETFLEYMVLAIFFSFLRGFLLRPTRNLVNRFKVSRTAIQHPEPSPSVLDIFDTGH